MRQPLALTACLLLLAASTASAYTFQDTGLCHAYQELATWAEDLEAENPNLVNVVQYGTTTSGRPLIALNVTINPAVNNPSKPEFLFTAGIHAREVITSEAARRLAETLVNGYRAGDPSYVSMLAERDVWIIPDQNPDGRVIVEGGESRQRKNMHLYSGQYAEYPYTVGVDLNRNYPHQWNRGDAVPDSDTYQGPNPLSEPESNSLWALLHDTTKFSNLTAAIDFHSGAQTILTPWVSSTEYYQSPLPVEDRQKFDSLAARMAQITGYSTQRLGYDSWGTLADSLYEEFGAYAMAEEIFVGPFYDYFSYFNPIDATTRDLMLTKAVNSALFLLSDEAFDITVPEPSTLVLLIAAGVLGMIYRGRRQMGVR